ncbi:BatA domain-containing protein [Rhodopirellula sp. JC740]|uniref:BatA domain-containing protein n=1 Tax=Rhodopirellula halodulae TaxID=2894198 RepID=A0ABS8NKL5_9BACT|nr:BatA domain-containing protein [Rhodopirellula sp. JC740]MCC9644103.1 BatA domain-containing protein [Rhodopirellula sp. JC740]
MSMLAPLFFAGALTIAAPILFHLIRQHPKGSVPFSSVMFLREVPPRLTRRSRLDQWPLLLIRSLALILLAAAFARPFLRSSADLLNQTPARRIALVIDRSASMQREDLWQQAVAKAESVIEDLSANDQFAIFVFDSEVKKEWESNNTLLDEGQRQLAMETLRATQLSWKATDLGVALREAADWAQWPETSINSETGDAPASTNSASSSPTSSSSNRSGPGPASLVLISDLQNGAAIDALQHNAWPEQVTLDIRRVAPREPGNATAVVMNDPTRENIRTGQKDAEFQLPIRVINSKLASQFDLSLTWDPEDEPQNIQVESDSVRVVRATPPAQNGSEITPPIVLSGDNSPFDNTVYWVAPEKRTFQLLHVGRETDEPRESLSYYLRRVPLDNATREVTIETVAPSGLPPDVDPKQCPLLVISQVSGDAAFQSALQQYTSDGGRLLFVMDDAKSANELLSVISALTSSENLTVEEAKVSDYAMWSEIDFSSPVFAAMSDPQFNDFSKIQFWNYRSVNGLTSQTETYETDWNVLASFDSGDPALARSGNVWLLTSGWQPSQSQLALSTKFLPLIAQLFTGNEPITGSSVGHTIGTPLPWPPSAGSRLIRSDGETTAYEDSLDAEFIDRPGVHQLRLPDETIISFASNLAETESQTDPMEEDTLERLGIPLGEAPDSETLTEATQQLRDRELESQQRLWQWLLLAAIILLAVETLWGGRYAKRIA